MPQLRLDRREFLNALIVAGAATPLASSRSAAAGRDDTLVIVQELGPNTLDLHGVGANQTVNGVSWNCYDRLMTYAAKQLPDGTTVYDAGRLVPELAESWEIGADGMSCTFRLREAATFHDATPVTAQDVKWSFDRAVSIGGFPTFQMSAGSLEKPSQFVVVDRHTFRVDFIRQDRMLMANLAVPVPFIINSELARKFATEQDPWASSWLKANEAGGGAYIVESWQPGSQTIYKRFDDWKSGPLPQIRRVIARDVPSSGTRRAMLERADADISAGLPPADFAQLSKEPKLQVVGTPIPNALWYIGLNTSRPPFDNPKLRQALAWATPYEAIQSAVFFDRAKPMFGATGTVEDAVWPQPFPYRTDLAKARALVVEAGFADGFATSLVLDAGTATVGEPAAVLVQENLARIGIRVNVEKIPGANWRATLNSKQMPMVLNRFSGWLDYPEYYFYWNFHSNNSGFNVSSYRNPRMDELIDAARFTKDETEYRSSVKAFIALCAAEVPVIPLNQPFHDVAMKKDVAGYRFWFHRELDFRPLRKD